MLRSSNEVTQLTQPFTIRVEKLPDGRFRASSPSAPAGGEIIATTLQIANAQLSDKLHKLHREGKL